MELDHKAIHRTFLAECEENLSLMERALVELESKPGDPELLNTIFRVVHTLKGNASALEFSSLAEYTHVLEDSLERLRAGKVAATPNLISVLLRSVDSLRKLIPKCVKGNKKIALQYTAILDQLQRLTTPSTKGRKRAMDNNGGIPDAAPSGSDAPAHEPDMARTIRVGIDKLDRMLNLTGEIAISRGRVRVMAEELGRAGEAILEALHEIDQLYIDLQEQVMQVRMVPLGPVFSQYARPIRDMARGLGKLARLEIEGANVELDTTVIEQIRDPLTHMVRNSIDHGIEAPDQRRAARKPPCGVLKFRAYHNAGSVVIQLCDDGAGFNRQKILERAIAMGKASQRDKLSDQQLYALIFEPGFSTAEKVTDLSGRGVGMDVVRRNVDLLHGSIEVESQEGIGATITIRLPLTLAIIDGFAVGVGEDSFIIPLDAVLECLDFPAEACSTKDQTGVINLRGDALPYLRLNRFFQYPCPGGRRENVVVVQHENLRAGLVVETLQGERQTVIKPLGKLFQGVPGISGSAILGNGKVGLILDVPSLLRDAIAQQQEACAPTLSN